MEVQQQGISEPFGIILFGTVRLGEDAQFYRLPTEAECEQAQDPASEVDELVSSFLALFPAAEWGVGLTVFANGNVHDHHIDQCISLAGEPRYKERTDTEASVAMLKVLRAIPLSQRFAPIPISREDANRYGRFTIHKGEDGKPTRVIAKGNPVPASGSVDGEDGRG